MADPASRQVEVNPALTMATWAGKMGLSCPLGIARDFPANVVSNPYVLSIREVSKVDQTVFCELCKTVFMKTTLKCPQWGLSPSATMYPSFT